VRDVAASHWLAEAVYRGFEILVALTGLVAGLPLMLIAAVVIRCDSPGPVLFFHQRPDARRPCADVISKVERICTRRRAALKRTVCITCRATSLW